MSTTITAPPPAPAQPELPPEYQWNARMPMVDPDSASAETQEAYGRFKKNHRALNNTVRQVGEDSGAIDLLNALTTVHATSTHIEKRNLEALRLRVAVACGCAYCTAWHTRFAEAAGFSDAEVTAIKDLTQVRPRELDSDAQLAVAVGHELTTGVLSESTLNDVRARWGDIGAIELVTSAAAQNATSRLAAALKTPMEPGYAKLLARKR